MQTVVEHATERPIAMLGGDPRDTTSGDDTDDDEVTEEFV